MQCPKCNSENLYYLSGWTIQKKRETHTDRSTQQWECDFPITKNLCKDCGLVFEAMEIADAEKFKKLESTFID